MEKKDILFLFDRPLEPVYYPKGHGSNKVIFEIPTDFLTEKLKPKSIPLLNKFERKDYRRINLGPYITPDIYIIDLQDVLTVKRSQLFSPFIPQHQAAAANLVHLFLSFNNFENFTAFAAYCRDRVNPDLFIYALSVALVHRDDSKGLQVPLLWKIRPNKFLDSKSLTEAKAIADLFESSDDREVIEIPSDFTGTNGDPEHRVAYWREDIGINLCHWHWHLVYPINGDMKIVNKDRRGELFYYLHHQIMARFTIERLCNDLSPPKRLMDWRKPIDLAYFPKLSTSVGGENWASRPAGLNPQDISVNENKFSYDIAEVERWRNRIFDAIHSKVALNKDGKKIELDADTGIDLLGKMVEPNILSVNLDYYGELHFAGHSIIAHVHDPKGFYKEPTGVMGDTATAMRDPIFYEWHGFLDDLFTEFKDSLAAYMDNELEFPGIKITRLELSTLDENGYCKDLNKLNTFWQKTELELSRGLDFAPSGSIYARITHLNHEDFLYHIEVDNDSGVEKIGTVRIFVAPVENFEGYTLNLNEQRKLMIEMDKFVVKLEPGRNVISRKSNESTLTIPFEQTFRDLNEGRPPSSDPEALDEFNFCGCGWPQHVLVPKGTQTGYSMQLFVMISNYEDDKIDQSEPTGCKTGVSFCGLKNLKYPDKRSMGYPFDRVPPPDVKTLNAFLKPNMKVAQFKIVHSNVVKQPKPSELSKN